MTEIRTRHLLAALVGSLGIGLLPGAWAESWTEEERLLIAPMIGGLDDCLIDPVDAATENDAHLKQDCRGPSGSAAAGVEATLAEIGQLVSPSTRHELGDALNVPLLRLFRQ